MNRHQLSILLYPLISTAKPGLNNIQGPGILSHLQTEGIIFAVAVGILIGKFIKHIVNVLNGLWRLGNTNGLCPVLAVSKAIAANLSCLVKTYHLSVYGHSLCDFLIIL